MAYVPEPVPTNGDLTTFLVNELARISDELRLLSEGSGFRIWNSSPTKPREGMIVIVDGTAWNPGGGAGVYSRTGGAWVKL